MPKTKAKTAPKTKPTSLITFLLDRSGSMIACREATIEAFNGYVASLKEEKDAVISFSLLQFDSVSLDKNYVNAPIADIPGLSRDTYQPRGSTPLIDAAVQTICAVETALTSRDDKPRVVVCIQTDGHENCSRGHTWEELRGLITAKTAEGWEFNFMGAGIEGYDQAVRMGIAAVNTMSYESGDRESTHQAFAANAANTRSFVKGISTSTAYSTAQRVGSGDKHFHKWVGGMASIPAAQSMTTPLDLTNATSAIPVTNASKPTSIIPDFKL